MSDTEETYFANAVAGAREYKNTGEIEPSLEWIDDLEGIAINGSHNYSIKSMTELSKLAQSENEEIAVKAREALDEALTLTAV